MDLGITIKPDIDVAQPFLFTLSFEGAVLLRSRSHTLGTDRRRTKA